MTPGQVQSLANNILENGLKENILLTHDGTTVVDGRMRLRACGVAGVAPRFSYLPKDTNEAELLRIMVTANIQSRKLTPGQLAMIGNALALVLESAETPLEDLANYPDIREYDNQSHRAYAAAVVGVSTKTVWQAKMIADYQPAMAVEVKEGTLRLNTAYERVMADRGLRKGPSRIAKPKDLPPIPNTRDNTKKAVEARRSWLRHLASEKMSAAEISQRLEISEEHVRRLARRYNIELPGDAWSYKRRKPNLDVNRIAQVVADDLMAMEDSFPRIKENLDQIDEDKAEEWAKIFWRASRQLSQLAKSLHYGTSTKKDE